MLSCAMRFEQTPPYKEKQQTFRSKTLKTATFDSNLQIKQLFFEKKSTNIKKTVNRAVNNA